MDVKQTENSASSLDSSEIAFLEDLEKGCFDAFEVLVRRFSSRIIGYARLLMGNCPEAEDVAQEVFLKVFRNRRFIQKRKLWPWLATITRNTCIDFFRERNHRRKIEKDANVDSCCSQTESDKTQGLPDYWAVLTEVEKEVLYLRLIEELEYGEISEITEMQEGSLRNVLSRGLKRLRERISENGL